MAKCSHRAVTNTHASTWAFIHLCHAFTSIPPPWWATLCQRRRVSLVSALSRSASRPLCSGARFEITIRLRVPVDRDREIVGSETAILHVEGRHRKHSDSGGGEKSSDESMLAIRYVLQAGSISAAQIRCSSLQAAEYLAIGCFQRSPLHWQRSGLLVSLIADLLCRCSPVRRSCQQVTKSLCTFHLSVINLALCFSFIILFVLKFLIFSFFNVCSFD